jgi:hypothetical protein
LPDEVLEEAASSIRVDFIFSSSPYEAEALSRVNRVTIGGSQVCYPSVEDLIIHKLVAGRPLRAVFADLERGSV